MVEISTLSLNTLSFTAIFLLLHAKYTTGVGGKRGVSCSHDTDCDQDSLIGCDKSTKTCDCPKMMLRLFYSPTDGKCQSYVGQDCTYVKSIGLPSITCVENAICFKNRDPQEVLGKCICKTGYYRTKDHFCAKNIPTNTNSISGGGIEVPRGKGEGRSSLANRYPEPYHSFSTASSSLTLSSVLIRFIPLFILIQKILDVS